MSNEEAKELHKQKFEEFLKAHIEKEDSTTPIKNKRTFSKLRNLYYFK